MIKHLLAATVAIAFTALPALAQNAGALAGSQSGSQSGAQSGSQAILSIQNNGAGEIRHSGSTTNRIEAAPDVVAPSLGSGHPCMINTSVGISVIGGGASGGRGEVDYGCMMMRSNNAMDNAAGRIYYASKDPAACKAWRSVGAIAANSLCDDKERRAAEKAAKAQPTRVSTKSTPTSAKVPYSKCQMTGNKITFKKAPGSSSAAAKAACMQTLGY